jgi:hypothetical protein
LDPALESVQSSVIRPKDQQQVVWRVVLAVAVDVVKDKALSHLLVEPGGTYVRMRIEPNRAVLPRCEGHSVWIHIDFEHKDVCFGVDP